MINTKIVSLIVASTQRCSVATKNAPKPIATAHEFDFPWKKKVFVELVSSNKNAFPVEK